MKYMMKLFDAEYHLRTPLYMKNGLDAIKVSRIEYLAFPGNGVLVTASGVG